MGGGSLKGETYDAHYRSFFENASHCTTDQSLQMSHVTSDVHLVPLHLAHVGCGFLNIVDIKAPHLRSPTPGQSLI